MVIMKSVISMHDGMVRPAFAKNCKFGKGSEKINSLQPNTHWACPFIALLKNHHGVFVSTESIALLFIQCVMLHIFHYM